jgi:hypothetical protein
MNIIGSFRISQKIFTDAVTNSNHFMTLNSVLSIAGEDQQSIMAYTARSLLILSVHINMKTVMKFELFSEQAYSIQSRRKGIMSGVSP